MPSERLDTVNNNNKFYSTIFFSFHSSEHLLRLSKSGTFFSELDWLMEVTKKVIEIKTYLKVIEIKFIFPAGLLSRTS